MTSLPRSTPEAQGISSSALSDFLEAARQKHLELHSLMLVRHGQVVAEGWWHPYSPDKIHLLYSLSKSFTSTAIGLAEAEGKLSVNDKVISFFPDDLPESVSDHLAAMTVHHLLNMATGHTLDTTSAMMQGENWARNFLAIPPDQAPGSIFCYNSGATYMLAAILHKLTGISLTEYLRPRLLEPLGITRTYWQEDPQGIEIGFSGLHVVTESIAKFGQLYLQKGLWQGQRLVSEAWVEIATAKHIENVTPDTTPDWSQGYGYQFWRCQHNAYRGDGAFGQYCVIMPQQNAVLAITSGVGDMQAVLDLVWELLLPAMGEPLDQNPEEHNKLLSTLAGLSIPPIQGEITSALADKISGKIYTFGSNALNSDGRFSLTSHGEPVESLRLDFQKETCTLTLKDANEHVVTAAYNQWLSGQTSLYGESKVEASGAWTDNTTFTLKILYIETPHNLTMTFKFEGDKVTLQRRWNVSFGELELPVIMGTK